MTRMFDATSPSEAFAPTPALPAARAREQGARASCSLSRRRGRVGWGHSTSPSPAATAPPASPASTRRPPCAPSSRATNAAISRRRPGQCRRRPGRRRHGRDRDRGRRGCCGHGHQPGGREGLPLHLRRLPHRAPACTSRVAAGSNGARRRPSCSTALACGAPCAWTFTLARGRCSARPWCSAGWPRASARARACCTTGSTSTEARSSPGPIASAWREATPVRWPRSPGWRGHGAGNLRLCRARRPALIDLARDLLAADGVRAGVTVVNGILLARFLAEDPLALRRAFTLFWARFRAAAAGLPPVLPRLWHV